MGFLSGSMSFERYWITADPTGQLGEEHLEKLAKHQVGGIKQEALEQPQVGFIAGAHLLDHQFGLEKNIVAEALHFGVRIDSDQIPAAIKKAWFQLELLPRMADNPSGRPTKAQREEAKEAVEARCLEEARTGKFRRLTQVPVLWDAQQDILYLGGTSAANNELVLRLLERAFDLELEKMSASSLAKAYASESKQLEALYKVTPAAFWSDQASGQITWWNGMAENVDFLGNEFLLWLWWRWETQGDRVSLGDESFVSGMFARSLALDCPLGEAGKESISAESPVALPEARLAIRSGKLPRRAGLTLVRHDEQYDLTVQAESFNLGGARITPVGERPERSPETRIQSIRELSDTVDYLYEAFCARRLSRQWNDDLKEIQAWLQQETTDARRKPAA